MSRQVEAARCCDFATSLGIKTPSSERRVVNLSGGNQQKIVIAKWVARLPKILIVDEPTRGFDIGAKAEVHALLARLAGNGMDGRIGQTFVRAQASQDTITEAATA